MEQLDTLGKVGSAVQGGKEQHTVLADNVLLLLTWRCWLGTEVHRPPEEVNFGTQKSLSLALNPCSEQLGVLGLCATRPMHLLPQGSGWQCALASGRPTHKPHRQQQQQGCMDHQHGAQQCLSLPQCAACLLK